MLNEQYKLSMGPPVIVCKRKGKEIIHKVRKAQAKFQIKKEQTNGTADVMQCFCYDASIEAEKFMSASDLLST